MEKILTWVFGIVCFIQLLIVIIACVINQIIDKEHEERNVKSEV